MESMQIYVNLTHKKESNIHTKQKTYPENEVENDAIECCFLKKISHLNNVQQTEEMLHCDRARRLLLEEKNTHTRIYTYTQTYNSISVDKTTSEIETKEIEILY